MALTNDILLAGFLFGGVMISFVLARLGYLDLDHGFRRSSAPGENYWLKDKVYRSILLSCSLKKTSTDLFTYSFSAGLLLHLACILRKQKWSL